MTPPRADTAVARKKPASTPAVVHMQAEDAAAASFAALTHKLDYLEDLGITPHLARKRTEHGSGLGVHRWVVEQTVALLHWFRRLRIRWEIPATTSTKPS